MLYFRKEPNTRVQRGRPEWEGERRQEAEPDEQIVWLVDRMITLTGEERSGLPTNQAEREVEETAKKIL